MSNISISNNPYSTTYGGMNPIKNLFVSEGEKLVSIIIYKFIIKDR